MAIEKGVILEGSSIGGEIFTFFGVGTDSNGRYNWGAIPNSSLINPKSKHKPVEFLSDATYTDSYGKVYGRRTQLNKNQRLSVNYGHNFEPYNNPLDAIRAVAGGTFFTYNRPSSWFRPADLWGYDHSTQNWCGVETNYTSVSKNGKVTVQIELDETMALGSITSRSINVTNVNIGLLMWNAAFSASQPQVYFYSFTNYANNESMDLVEAFKIDCSKLSAGTWYMYPCLTTANVSKDTLIYYRGNAEEYGASWFPLPFCNTKAITVLASGQGGGDDDVSDEIITLTESGVDYTQVDSTYFRVSRIYFTLENLTDVDQDVDFIMTDADKGNISMNSGQLLIGGRTTIPANETITEEILYGDKEGEGGLLVGCYTTPIQIEVEFYRTGEDGHQTLAGTVISIG